MQPDPKTWDDHPVHETLRHRIDDLFHVPGFDLQRLLEQALASIDVREALVAGWVIESLGTHTDLQDAWSEHLDSLLRDIYSDYHDSKTYHLR